MNSEEEHLLIDLIQHYPFLYDKASQDFKDNNKKNNAWDSIATALSISVEEAQKSWKNLREKFAKERKRVKNITSGSEAPECQWPLYIYMGFMEKHVTSRRRVSNVVRPVSECSNISSKVSTPLTSPTDDGTNIWGSVDCIIGKDGTLLESDGGSCETTGEASETQDFTDTGPPLKKIKGSVFYMAQGPSTSGTKSSKTKTSSVVEDTLGVLTSYLHEKKKPDKNTAFGDYVGLTLSEMPTKEQNYKKLKIVEILNETFED